MTLCLRCKFQWNVIEHFQALLVHESVSDHYIRCGCVSVCLSVCPEHSSVGFDPILIKILVGGLYHDLVVFS